MKLPALLLAGSLLANAAFLAAFAVKPALAPPVLHGFFQGLGGARETAATPAMKAPPRAPRAAIPDRAKYWSTLAASDLPALLANLRGAGFSPALIRAIIAAHIEQQFRERLNALARNAADAPFWKPDPSNSINNRGYYDQLNQIYRERTRLLRQLIGDDYLAGSAGEATAAQRRQYGDLPKDKIDLVERIAADYADMASQIRAAMQGISLPSDREKLALLEREKRADLASVLTPQELADYDLRNSTITSRLRPALTIMDASEDEFRTIYRATQAAADAIYAPGGVYGPEMARIRQEGQAKVNEVIKAALGETRYADYARANDREFQQLYGIGQRDNVSTDLLVRAFDLRDGVLKESSRIYEDKQMSNDDKRVALATLGQSTKAQVISLLGPTTGNAYIQSAGWLTAPERGWVPRINPSGNTTYYALPNSAPPTN